MHGGNGRLQAVGEVAKGIAIAQQAAALAAQQGIEAAGHAYQLSRPAPLELLAPAVLDLADLRLDTPQRLQARAQPDPQRHGQRTHQDQCARAEPEPQPTTLREPGLEALGGAQVEAFGGTAGHFPADTQRHRQHASTVRQGHALEHALARSRPGDQHQATADAGRRAPLCLTRLVAYLGEEPRARGGKTRIGESARHQLAGSDPLRRRHQRDYLGVEHLTARFIGDAAEQRVERQRGDGRQHHGQRRQPEHQPYDERRRTLWHERVPSRAPCDNRARAASRWVAGCRLDPACGAGVRRTPRSHCCRARSPARRVCRSARPWRPPGRHAA